MSEVHAVLLLQLVLVANELIEVLLGGVVTDRSDRSRGLISGGGRMILEDKIMR